MSGGAGAVVATGGDQGAPLTEAAPPPSHRLGAGPLVSALKRATWRPASPPHAHSRSPYLGGGVAAAGTREEKHSPPGNKKK